MNFGPINDMNSSRMRSESGHNSNDNNTGSGAGTLVGDNMALGDDPFNGRTNLFNGGKKPNPR